VQITLNIDGNEKTYDSGFIKARLVRSALELSEKVDYKKITSSTLDSMVGWFCQDYGNQFTVDEVYDGLPAETLLQTITDTVREVGLNMSTAVHKIPKNE
jgi:hypothetical protein